jgi:hypothetical protein
MLLVLEALTANFMLNAYVSPIVKIPSTEKGSLTIIVESSADPLLVPLFGGIPER